MIYRAKRRMQWMLSWMAFKVVLWCPWILWALLPVAGEYAYAEEPDRFESFCANRDRLEDERRK